MAEAIKCDRCGQFAERGTTLSGNAVRRTRGLGTKDTFDLCHPCTDSLVRALEQWLSQAQGATQGESGEGVPAQPNAAA